MKLFDLHVDTAIRLYFEGLPFTSPTLGVSAADSKVFERITRVYALFSRPWLSDDEAYLTFFPLRKHLLSQLSSYRSPDFSVLLSVEDARLLANDRSRLPILHRHGVRILTLTWSGTTCIGGAYDTADGLTPFGREILSDCFSHGILPDVSHASDATFCEVAEASIDRGHPLLATHSNSRAVCPHTRNLSDDQFLALLHSGGLCGLSLCPRHLTPKSTATSADLLRHLEHYFSLGGENAVAIGTDLDGIDATPADLTNTRDLLTLANEMARLNYKDTLIRKFFYKNAEAFFGKYLIRQEEL